MTIFAKFERYVATALLGLMGVVVIAAAAEVAYQVVMGLLEPPGLFLNVSELRETFGLFLMVLIGLELMVGIHMFMNDHTIHVEMMLLVALTAVTRKILVLDAPNTEPMLIFSVGFLILALSGGHFLARKK